MPRVTVDVLLDHLGENVSVFGGVKLVRHGGVLVAVGEHHREQTDVVPDGVQPRQEGGGVVVGQGLVVQDPGGSRDVDCLTCSRTHGGTQGNG